LAALTNEHISSTGVLIGASPQDFCDGAVSADLFDLTSGDIAITP
jgi:hypothetical protein